MDTAINGGHKIIFNFGQNMVLNIDGAVLFSFKVTET